MAVQTRLNNANTPFVLYGVGASEMDAVIAQNAGRSTDLAYGTVMAKIAATQKWVPFTDETATDGSAIPQGIYLGDAIAAADIVAGDISDAEILVGMNVTVDKNALVIENSKTLDTVITVGTTDLRTVEDHLANRGIFMEDSVDISSYENT